MTNQSGCEMIACGLWDKDRRICTDIDPRFDHICRHNQYWQTEEGQRELEEYEL